MISSLMLSAKISKRKIDFLDKSIVLIPPYPPQAGTDNLRTLQNISAFYHLCPNTLFIGWDWDNHFNLHISSIFSAASDFYFHPHLANDYELSKFCTYKYHMPSGAYQWSRSFLTENIDLIMRPDRISEVFGRFKSYGLFGYRNTVVKTLSNNLKEVSLVEDLSSYHDMDLRQKLEGWTRFKCHWIVLTLNDVSTRVFDVLITGGILIIPEQLRSDPIIKTIDERDFFFHNDADILEPQDIARRAIEAFDRCGVDGVLRRHRFAIDNHNLDCRLKEMFEITRNLLDKMTATLD